MLDALSTKIDRQRFGDEGGSVVTQQAGSLVGTQTSDRQRQVQGGSGIDLRHGRCQPPSHLLCQHALAASEVITRASTVWACMARDTSS